MVTALFFSYKEKQSEFLYYAKKSPKAVQKWISYGDADETINYPMVEVLHCQVSNKFDATEVNEE